MDFSLSAEQQRRHDRIRTAARELLPGASPAEFREKSWRRMAVLGLVGAAVPQEHGGAGLGALDTALLYEGASEGGADTGLLFAAAAHLFACVRPVLEFALPRTRKALLPALCSGELIAGNAMTEPDAGSDVSRLATTATRVDGGYLIDGTKSFVSNGPVADLYVTYATTDPAGGYFGTTAFAVDRDSPGLVAGPPLDKSALTACQAGEVRFDRCFVPDERVLGSPGQGQLVFQTSMLWERSCLFAIYLGQQERLIERCVHHVRHREQFGRKLADLQPVADRLAEMRLRLESGRLLLRRACAGIDDGQDPALWVAMAKLAVSEAAVATSLDAARIFGGRAFLTEYGIEEHVRDAAPATTFSGTSDIQRQLIAREMGL
ncbi:acyl-CoA dehydrogenase family protein [Streptomyces sp. NPDC101237]|uniref:acyl-CoA dehydrogenase family protein n=1 Tax=Streptomyces sp. NPDC101237 TaxID=3366139 RepID=UPI00380C5529